MRRSKKAQQPGEVVQQEELSVRESEQASRLASEDEVYSDEEPNQAGRGIRSSLVDQEPEQLQSHRQQKDHPPFVEIELQEQPTDAKLKSDRLMMERDDTALASYGNEEEKKRQPNILLETSEQDFDFDNDQVVEDQQKKKLGKQDSTPGKLLKSAAFTKEEQE